MHSEAETRTVRQGGDAGFGIRRFSGWAALFRKDMLEQLRSGHLFVICLVFAFFGITSPMIAKYTPQVIEMVGSSQNIVMIVPEPVMRDAFVQYVKNLSQLIPIFLIFLTMGGISREKETGTIAFVLVKPVTRLACLLSKILVQVVLVTIGLALAAILAGFYTIIFFGPLSLFSFLRGNAALWLYCVTVVLVTQGFSAMSGKPVGAGIGALAVWLVFMVLKMLPGIGPYSFAALTDAALGAMEGFTISWKPAVGALTVGFFTAVLGYFEFRRWE